MLGFLKLRRQRLAGLESEADRLTDAMGSAAYETAGRLAREANDFWTMRYWTSVQAILAQRDVRHRPQTTILARPTGAGARLEAPSKRRDPPPPQASHDQPDAQDVAALGQCAMA
jgi:hypothetical protein